MVAEIPARIDLGQVVAGADAILDVSMLMVCHYSIPNRGAISYRYMPWPQLGDGGDICLEGACIHIVWSRILKKIVS
jgi:hypothetical protein